MVGQWVRGFGVPMAAMSGKQAIQQLCGAEGKTFRADGCLRAGMRRSAERSPDVRMPTDRLC
jgi:hypothetical protein